MTYRFVVHVAGRLPQAFTDAIGIRFGKVVICNEPSTAVLKAISLIRLACAHC